MSVTNDTIGKDEFEILPGSSLTEADLRQLTVADWLLVGKWSVATTLQVTDSNKVAWLKARFGNNSAGLKAVDRRVIKMWISKVSREAEAVPSYMAVEKAVSEGHQVLYTAEKAVVQGTVVSVPISRVPLNQEALAKKSNGERSARVGSDILAIMIASATKWNGKAVTISLPADTLAKFDFAFVDPKNVEQMVNDIPAGPPEGGRKGRAWAFYLMHLFQTMDLGKYYALQSEWIQSIYSLRPPTVATKLSPVYAENFSVTCYKGSYYYVFTFTKPQSLRGLKAYFSAPSEEAEFYGHLMSFNSVRQGDNTGLSMLAAGRDTWGMASDDQETLEQIVSVLMGVQEKRIVISGLSEAQLQVVRASVRALQPQKVVYGFAPIEKANLDRGTTYELRDSLYLVYSSRHISTEVPVTKMGKTRVYDSARIKAACWSQVEALFSSVPEPSPEQKAKGAHSLIFYGAVLPYRDTKLTLSTNCSAWDSVYFVSRGPLKGFYHEDGQVKEMPLKTYLPQAAWQWTTRSMNNAVSYWAAPRVNTEVRWINLLSPPKAPKNMRAQAMYNSEDGEYVITYVPEDEGSRAEVIVDAFNIEDAGPPTGPAPDPPQMTLMAVPMFVSDEDG